MIAPLTSEPLATWRDTRNRGLTPPARPESTLAIALDRPYPLVSAAATAVSRAGVDVLSLLDEGEPLDLPQLAALGDWVAAGNGSAAVFCVDPGLVCCVANKAHGVRAVAISTVAQALRAMSTVAANLLAVEMPGRTYWEVRQMLSALAKPATVPAKLQRLLREMQKNAAR